MNQPLGWNTDGVNHGSVTLETVRAHVQEWVQSHRAQIASLGSLHDGDIRKEDVLSLQIDKEFREQLQMDDEFMTLLLTAVGATQRGVQDVNNLQDNTEQSNGEIGGNWNKK